MRFRDLMRNINRHEQKLENVLLYVDFINHELPIILLKDGSLLLLFQLSGLDYEGLSEEQKEQFSHYTRSAFEQLPDEGAGFMLSNLLIRETPQPLPLLKNAAAPPLIQFVHSKKQAFWDDLISKSYGNRILCGLRYYQPKKKEPNWSLLIQEKKLFRFYLDQLREGIEKLELGYLALSSSLARFGFKPLDREESFAALYRLINFSAPPDYRADLSLNAQLAQSQYLFKPNDECLVINGREFVSLIGMKYPPPTSIAMYLRRFYELNFPLILRQSIGFAPKERLFKQQDFNTPIALALSTMDAKNLKYVEEVKNFRGRIENDKELPVWWHFSILVRAGDKETLRTRRAEVISLLKEIGSFGVPEKRNLKAGFFSLLPGHDRFYLRKALLGTANVGDLLSAYVLYPGDNNPVDYLQDRLNGVFAYNPFTSRERAHHRAICGPTVGGKSFFVIKDLISHLIVNPMIWVVDLSASYLDLFELLREEMPSETAIMRVSRQDSNFQFNPFLLADPGSPVPTEQFEFCMGLLKLIAGPKLTTPANEMAMRKGLAEFFNAYRILLRNQQERIPVPPMTLLASIMEMEIKHPELASAFALWTVGRRGELFNTGKDTLQSARYCYFDLRDLDGEPELMTAIVYVIFSKVYRDIADENLRSIQKRFVLDEAHRYITDPAFSYWISLLARTGRHWNIMLDLITQSLADLDSPDQPWSKAIITNLKQAFFFSGQKDVEASFRKLQLTDYHIQQYKKLDPSRYEVMYWSEGGLRRMLRSVADHYTYWLATTDARERTMKKRMKERFQGNVRQAMDELVKLTGHCRNTEERLAILETYFE
jgi:type IV secretory pathway VirB4 component